MGIEVGTLMAVSMAVSAAGAAYSGYASAEAANYQAEVAKQNAELAKQKATMAAQVGAQEEERLAMQSQQQMGKIRAAFGASGVDVNTGSHALVQMGEAEMTSVDQQLAREKTMRNIWGYQTEATSAENQSTLYAREATNSLIGGGLKAAGSLASGSATGAEKFGWFAT